jgi:hypothetical protein
MRAKANIPKAIALRLRPGQRPLGAPEGVGRHYRYRIVELHHPNNAWRGGKY